MTVTKTVSNYLTHLVWGGFLGVYVDRVLLNVDRSYTEIVLGVVLLGITLFHGYTEVKESL